MANPAHELRDGISRTPFEPPDEISDRAFMDALSDVVAAADETGVAYGLVGGLATSIFGRPRWTRDIDLLCAQTEAPVILEGLERRGFMTERTNSHWIYKGIRDGILVDVLFQAKGRIYFDDEMAARCRTAEFRGQAVRVIPPEDLIVIKAIVHDEETPRHWHDALSVIAGTDLDWDYLIRRAQNGARRVLSLLLYAQADDLVVPSDVIDALYHTIYGAEGT